MQDNFYIWYLQTWHQEAVQYYNMGIMIKNAFPLALIADLIWAIQTNFKVPNTNEHIPNLSLTRTYFLLTDKFVRYLSEPLPLLQELRICSNELITNENLIIKLYLCSPSAYFCKQRYFFSKFCFIKVIKHSLWRHIKFFNKHHNAMNHILRLIMKTTTSKAVTFNTDLIETDDK